MIDFTKSKQYTLSIRLSTDGFSFSIYNPINDNSQSLFEKEVDTSLSLTANLKNVFHESDFLSYSYKRVNIMIASKRFTMIPLELFEEEQAELLFYHNHQKRENEIVMYNILKKNNVVVIFGIDKSTYTFLNEQYPEARFYSQSTRSSSIFLSKADWGIVRKCMLQYAKMPLTFTVSNGGSYFWPTLSSACKPKIVSTIYYMSGSNWNLIRNGMNYI